MKKSVWDIMPIILAFVLLVSIFSVLISIMQNTPKPLASIIAQPTLDIEVQEEENNINDIIEIVPYYTNFPKYPSSDNNFLFRQNLSGYGDIIIKNIHKTSIGTFCILETDCQFGDITVENKSVIIAKISDLVVVEKIFILPSYKDLFFLSSQITANGLAILCHNNEHTILFNIDYELDFLENVTLPLSTKGDLFFNVDTPIILLKNNQNNIYKENNGKLMSTFLPAGEIIDIFDFYYYFIVIINQENNYCVIKLSTELKKIQETYIQGATVKDLVPFHSNNQQYYIIAEEKKGVTTLYKYNSNFIRMEESVQLGEINKIHLLQDGENIVALFYGQTKGIYSFDNNMNCTLLNLPLLQNVDIILDYNIFSNKYYILCNINENIVLLSYANNTYSQLVIDEIATEEAFFVWNSNSTISIFYQNKDIYEFQYTDIVCCNYS